MEPLLSLDMISTCELIYPLSFNPSSLLIPPHSMSPGYFLGLSPSTYWEHLDVT